MMLPAIAEIACQKLLYPFVAPKFFVELVYSVTGIKTCLHKNQRDEISCLVKFSSYRLDKVEVISSKIGSFSFSTAGSSLSL